MNPTHTLNNSDTGSRLHFLLAAALAVIISIGLTSTAAMAGLMPTTESATAFTQTDSLLTTLTSADVPGRAGTYQPAVIATPSFLVDEGAASQLASRPYLEEEQEFAPKFQHVVARGRPGRRGPLDVLSCALSITRTCAHPARL